MQGHDMTGMATVGGVSLSAEGLVLAPIAAPEVIGESGTLAFLVETDDGTPVTAFASSHGREMHLIVVRSDGADFRHVHPALDVHTGVWSIPWTWTQAGSYRVYADFSTAAGVSVTLSRTVQVAGDLVPVWPLPNRVSEVGGYTVTLVGDLAAGGHDELRLTVTTGGEPVVTLEPYLGAFGHLVALREGDLAFLHVHPDGDEPAPGDLGGPAITFATMVPTAGRYLLYLDFQVGGIVRTASFVLDATYRDPHAAHRHHAH